MLGMKTHQKQISDAAYGAGESSSKKASKE